MRRTSRDRLDARPRAPVDRRGALALLVALAAAAACGRSGRGGGEGDRGADGRIRLHFRHQPFWGDPAAFRAVLADFERANPRVELVATTLPNASDLAHQSFVTALEAASPDLDVFVVDVVWVAEFARAGWLADLSALAPELEPARLRERFVRGAADAAIARANGDPSSPERAFAVPWYVDVGLLYRRRDLIPEPVRTYEALEEHAARVAADARVAGYVWQGRQYEGLVCNAYEAVWGHGGEATRGPRGRLALDEPAAERGLAYLRRLIATGCSPRAVLTMAEEESRRVFQSGGAALLRNWPYAFAEAEREGSPVRGKVAIQALPTESGEPGAGALGGYHLALRAGSPPEKREAAVALVAHLTSRDAAVKLALAYGRNPALRDAWADPRLAAAPFTRELAPIVERARPRPVTPYYGMLTDALQGELSAAVSGLRPARDALARAQRLCDHVMGLGS